MGAGVGTLSAPFWCLCQKLSLSLLYFNKALLHKSSEWSSLVSGLAFNSSIFWYSVSHWFEDIKNFLIQFHLIMVSVQFSLSVVSDSLRSQIPKHTRLPCPSPTPGVYPNSCPLSQRWDPTISSSVIPFSSRLQSFPASGSFQMRQFFASGV